METRDRIPHHLRRYVVEHDVSAYDQIDQSVWRFVLAQMHERGLQCAHPAYARGLAETGISTERIPSIQEMDRCLARFGWGAVAVDGFIPPRAFQEFQAHSILTIAADIRRPEHLAYTPAPDIIHESAGHAPIIPDPEYRRFLQRFGEIGAKAFSSPEDEQLYRAVRRLSEVKEDTHSTPERVRSAEAQLCAAQEAVTDVSEAALLSRLHWWTVEYGLIGTPASYKLYGAGLLSSLGESHFLWSERVRKLPLSASCVEVGYDITAPQPQLFVAESFVQLSEVLEEVADALAQRVGGALALKRAQRAAELATLELSSGLSLIGVLTEVLGSSETPEYLRLSGPCALALDGRILADHDRSAHPDGYGTPIGPLASGRNPETLRPDELNDYMRPDGQLELEYRSGVLVCGRLIRRIVGPDGCVRVVSLEGCRVVRGERVLFDPDWGHFDLALAQAVRSAYAGPLDASYWPDTEFSQRRVPTSNRRSANERCLLDLYCQFSEKSKEADPRRALPEMERIHERLCAEAPDDWLLRWNLLGYLYQLNERGALASELRSELLQLEQRNPCELPITTGLSYLDRHYSGA